MLANVAYYYLQKKDNWFVAKANVTHSCSVKTLFFNAVVVVFYFYFFYNSQFWMSVRKTSSLKFVGRA